MWHIHVLTDVFRILYRIAADVTLKDNSAEVKNIFRSAVRRGLKAIGMAAEGHAKRKIRQADRIDTGGLINSISHKSDNGSA